MSALAIRILICDGVAGGEVCPAEFGGDPKVRALATLRRAAREAGWRRKSGGRDLCPDCVEGGTR